MTRILIVDDDRELCDLVSDFLEPHGFSVDVETSATEGLRRILTGNYQAVILDVMMPEMDGVELLKLVRRESDVPVLMFTSRGDDIDRVVGLEIGADDYIPKTASSRELLARLRAVLRRTTWREEREHTEEAAPLFAAPIRLDTVSRRGWLDNDELELTRTEFDLLAILIRRRGHVLSRDFLLERLSGREHEWDNRSMDVHVSALRRKLGDDPRTPRFIKTVRGIGYMLLEDFGEP